MEMYRFLLSSDTTRGALFILFAVIAGFLQSCSAYLIGLGAEQLRFGHGSNIYHLGLFVGVLGLLGVTLQRATTLGLLVAERSTGRMAVRLAARVRDVELVRLEQIGSERILAAIALDMTTITNAAVTAVNAVISATALAGAALVIVLATRGIVIVWLPLVLLVLGILRAAEPGIRAAAARADAAEKVFCALAAHALDGFKELRLDAAKMRDLVGHFALDAVLGVLHERVRAGTQYAARLVSIHVLRFITVGAIVYVLPQFGVIVGGTVALVVVAFSFQSLLEIIAYQPILSNCAVSLERLRSLETELWQFREAAPEKSRMARPGISSIRLENISFTYTDHSGAAVFTVGPFDLTLEAGQILFVAGGNGSGKSTFLKLLTGLYPHSSGSIEVDGATTGIADYRALFSTVFTDFHLFDQLYGVPSPDPQRVEDLLRQLRLGQKAAIVDNAFSTTKLSTGQRKRLALIAAVLEDRPVIIFDEWTADQDPEFRETFYKDLLPQLRREGRTVIAVTHDDRYFKYCNRLITMQDGRITGDEAFAMDHSSTS